MLPTRVAILSGCDSLILQNCHFLPRVWGSFWVNQLISKAKGNSGKRSLPKGVMDEGLFLIGPCLMLTSSPTPDISPSITSTRYENTTLIVSNPCLRFFLMLQTKRRTHTKKTYTNPHRKVVVTSQHQRTSKRTSVSSCGYKGNHWAVARKQAMSSIPTGHFSWGPGIIPSSECI